MLRLRLAGIVSLALMAGVVVAPAAATESTTALLVGSRVGVTWTADDGTSGTAQLAGPNVGCHWLDPEGYCGAGVWPRVPNARWIWRTASVTSEEAVGGTPWVTFSDTFTWDGRGDVVLAVAADDEYVVRLNGVQVAAGGMTVSTVSLAPDVGENALTVVVRSLAGPQDPFSSPAGVAYAVGAQGETGLALEAATTEVPFGTSVALTARLSTPAAVRTISVYAKPDAGSESMIFSGEPDAEGALAVVVQPTSTTTYVARSPGGGGWPALESSRVRIVVRTALVLSASRATVPVGSTVTLAVSLRTGASSRLVVLRSSSRLGSRVVARIPVPAVGVWRVTLRQSYTTRYTATWAASEGWAGVTRAITVGAAPVWTGKTLGGYATSAGVRLYHWSAACRAPSYRGCPERVFTMTPVHRGARVWVEFQWLSRTGWRDDGRYRWTLDRRGKVASFTWYTSRAVIGVTRRAHAVYRGDEDHAASTSRWVTWRVTR